VAKIKTKEADIVTLQVKLRALQLERDLQEVVNLGKPATEVEKREKELA